MIIPLKLTEDFRPSVEATIQGPHIFGRIGFLVDTGSPNTIISEGHALILKIPINRLSKDRPITGWGGASYKSYVLNNVKINFKTDENGIFTINFPKILISQLTTKRTEEERRISLSFPSVIGTDLFKNNGLLLYFDPSKSIAYIKKEE
jgi:hypothetical protein